MKFNNYLKSHRVPEWRTQYIDYRQLKKLIRKATQSEDADATTERETSDAHDADADDSEAEVVRDRVVRSNLDPAQHDLPEEIMEGVAGIGSGEVSSDPDSIDVKSATQPSRSDTQLRRRTSAQSRASSRSSTSRGPVEAIKKPRLPNSLRRSGGWRFPPSTPLQRILPQLNDAERKFFTTIVKELDKVESFYREREDQIVARFKQISDQLDELERHRRAHELAKRKDSTMHLPDIVRNSMPSAVTDSVRRAKQYVTHVDTVQGARESSAEDKKQKARKTALAEPLHDDVDDLVRNVTPGTYLRARKALKAAIFEEYRFLGMLKSYRALNRVGFSKSLKKMEKNTHIPCSSSFMQRVNDSHFVSSTKLDELTSQAENMFAQHFEGGSRKRALTRLRMLGQKKTHHFSAGRAGIWLGAAAPAIIDGIVKACWSETRQRIPYWPALLQLYGALLLPVALACSIMANLSVWHGARINWSLIFEFDIRTMMDWHEYLELPAFLLFLLSYAFWFSWTITSVPPEAWPLAWVIAVIVIFFNPLPILHLHARWWFLGSIGRVFTAGLVPSIPVAFRDFWLGDLLCSLYYLFFICAYNRRFDDIPPRCNTNSTWASPALASIPSLCRLGQSIRRYIDSDGSSIHALNAGKYSVQVIYFWLYFAWRIRGSAENDPLFAFFIVSAFLNSVYLTGWDLIMDWNLLNRPSKHFLLRSDLVYKNQVPTYYAAMVGNTMLRFTWVIYLIPGTALSVGLRGFLVAVIEVFRRFVWCFYRLEAEQVGNADAFRVTREVPLPFAIDKSSKEEAEEETMAESGLSTWALHPVVRLGQKLRGATTPAREGSDEALRQEGGSPAIPRAKGPSMGVDSSASDDEEDDEDEGVRGQSV